MKIALRILFWFGIAFTIVAPIVIALHFQSLELAALSAGCGVFVTLISRFDELSELSFGVVRARMREKIDEANATLDELRQIAVVISDAILSQIMMSAFWGGMPIAKQFQVHDKIISTLSKIGVDEQQIQSSLKYWNIGVKIRYRNAIKRRLSEIRNSDNKSDIDNVLSKMSELFKLGDEYEIPKSYEIREIIENIFDNIDSEIEEILEDYQHFCDMGEVRNITLLG